MNGRRSRQMLQARQLTVVASDGCSRDAIAPARLSSRLRMTPLEPFDVFQPPLPSCRIALEQSLELGEHERVGAAGAARLVADGQVVPLDDLMDMGAVLLRQG